MTHSTPWKNYADRLYCNQELNFYLDLSHSNIDGQRLESLDSQIQKALSEMSSLENGAISNPDENRQVGHYWLRNPALSPSPAIRDSINNTLHKITTFTQSVLNGELTNTAGEKFTDLLLVGIGGSALGPQFIAEALGSSTGLSIRFLDNTDPDGVDYVMDTLSTQLPQTLVLVISKSGGTAETRNGMLEVQNIFSKRNLDFAKQAVAITGEGSQLFNLATREGWLSIFPMWDWVGGRTSVMSAVGILPAALMGIKVDELLAGAAKMDEITRSSSVKENPAALLALSWYIIGEGQGQKDMVILPYKDRLILFSRYLQQLIMESLGKRLDLEGHIVHQGIAVYGNKGSTDQHAYVQQLRDGLNNFFVTFIEVLADRNGDSIKVDDANTSGDYLFGFLKGTETALYGSERQSLTITIPDLSPRSIGALIALYERAVGLYASLVNINAYHQPGVEAGKKAAGDVLELKNQILTLLNESDMFMSVQDIGEALNIQDSGIMIYQILRHHAANHPMQVKGSFTDPTSLTVKL